MATIIDSLIVTLGLDSKDVDAKAPGVRSKLADLEKAASKTEHGVKGIGKASKDTGSELTVLSAKLGSFLAVIGGTVAVRAFLKNTIETNTQLYFLSRNLDISTQKLFAWSAASQEIGGSKGGMQNFMRTIAEMPGQLLTGQMPKLLPLFARLGISFREPFSQIMVDLSKRFSGMDRKVAFSFGLAAGIPEDMMNLLLEGPGAVEAATKRTAKFAPSSKEVESAKELKRGVTDLELQFVKIGYDLLYKITPALEKFLGFLQSIGGWAQKHEKLVALVAGIAAGLASIAGAIGIVTAASSAFMAILGVFASPVMGAVAVIAALGAAILLLWNDYKVWSEGGISHFDWAAWIGWIQKATNVWNDLSGAIGSAWQSLEKWSGKATHVVSHAASTVLTAIEKNIAGQEGFYASGNNIPKRAHNPGDILYSPFAIAHGATGYLTAAGGKKIATFPDDATGFRAMDALLKTKGYANLTPEQTISRWQTGRSASLMDGIGGAAHVPSSIAASTHTSSSHTDNSKTTHIGTINLHNPPGSAAITPSMARGMDWTTLATQLNFGVMP